MRGSFQHLESFRNHLTLESLVNGTGILILCGLFLIWETSRTLYVVTSIFALGYLIKVKPRLPGDHLLFTLPVYGFIVTSFFALLYHGLPDRGINIFTSKYLLLLLAVPLVSLYFCQFNANRNAWLKFMLAAMILGVMAPIDIFVLEKARANAGNNAVIFGAVAVAMTSIVAASYHVLRERRYGTMLYATSVFFGVVAILLSGSRGSWIAALINTVIVIMFLPDSYSLTKRIVVSVITISCIAALSMSVPQIRNRAHNTVTIVASYLSGDRESGFTSVSYRIETWKAAWHMGINNGVFGVGPGNFRKSLKSYVQEHKDLEGIEIMKHAHNQYMQAFATSGFTGLVAFLVLLGAHLWLFARYLMKRYPREVRSFAFAGFILVIAYIFLSVISVPFDRKKLILLYGFGSASLWGCLLGALQHCTQTQNDSAITT